MAVLILKSAIELAMDLSRYQMELTGWYERFRQAQLRDWLLYLVEREEARTHGELMAQARQAFDVSRNRCCGSWACPSCPRPTRGSSRAWRNCLGAAGWWRMGN